jgi:hypothetical protein
MGRDELLREIIERLKADPAKYVRVADLAERYTRDVVQGSLGEERGCAADTAAAEVLQDNMARVLRSVQRFQIREGLGRAR